MQSESLNNKLPSHLNDNIAIDVILELRFDSDLPGEIIAGSLWSALKGEGQNNFHITKLPIADLPDQVRDSDPNLKYQPHFKLTGPHAIIQVGPNSLGIAPNGKYSNWVDFKQIFNPILDSFFSATGVDKLNRVAIRYINFIKGDIFNHLRYGIVFDANPACAESINLRLRKIHDGNSVVLMFMNDATITGSTIQELIGAKGSIFDIDCSREAPIHRSESQSIIETVHASAKSVFFGALSRAFIDSLGPVYEGEKHA